MVKWDLDYKENDKCVCDKRQTLVYLTYHGRKKMHRARPGTICHTNIHMAATHWLQYNI